MKKGLSNGLQFSIHKAWLAVLICLSSFAGIAQIAPSLTFKNSVLVSGTALQQGAVYRFPSVYPGVDAFVTIQNLLNGATVTNIDQTGGVGYDDAFQPIINTVSGSPNSLGRFLFEFRTTAGVNYTFPILAATGLDIDGGTSSLLEFCTIDMAGGITYYQGNTPEISVARSGTGYKASNVAGNNFNGIDTLNKAVMFTVRKSNLFSMTIDFGCVRTSGSGGRNYAVYFKDFMYPFQNVLPVKIISFTATPTDNNTINIIWSTSIETNASHFEIERSFDGIQFNTIGRVVASGNSNLILNYSYTDITSTNTKNLYYRLRIVDSDGKYKYSSICAVKILIREESELHLRAYPNPVVNVLQITFPSQWINKQAVLEIYTSTGMLAARKITSIGSYEETLNVSELPPSSYMLVVRCNNQTIQQKFIKQ